MRIFEIENNLTIWRTERFQDHLETYIRSDPSLINLLKEFISAKSLGIQFGKKDSVLGSGPLSGIGRCHLIHGKVIVVYQLKATDLFLYDINEHTAIEGKAARDLARYIQSISADKLKKYQTPSQPEKITAQQIQILNDFIRALIENSHLDDMGQQAISAALEYDDWEFLQMFWAEADTQNWDWQSMVNLVGGVNKLKQVIRKKVAMPNKTFYE